MKVLKLFGQWVGSVFITRIPAFLLLAIFSGNLHAADAYEKTVVRFENRGAQLVGTLYLPSGTSDKVPGIVYVHGSVDYPRAAYHFIATHFVQKGFAVLLYDKRGIGDSSGVFERDCNTCPENLELLASDAAAAFSLLAARPEVKPDRVGFLGVSQAGWIIPKAAVMNGHVAFAAMISAPVVTVHEGMRYERFTNGRDPGKDLSPTEIETLVDQADITLPGRNPLNSPDSDPVVEWRKLNFPALWLFGDRDWLMPLAKSTRNLDALISAGKPYRYEIIEGATHAQFPGPKSRTQEAIDAWLERILRN